MMTDPTAFAPDDPGEPLGLLVTGQACPVAGATARRFELNSRGDRVPGRLLLPDPRSGPCPLILLLGDVGASRESASLNFAASWPQSGFGVATIDLSLHGERSSAKFGERLVETIERLRRGADPGAIGEALLAEFTRQSVCDLSRTLDGLLSLPAIDSGRVGLLGLGYGAAIVAIAASRDPRPGAIALAHCDVLGSPEIDPRQFVAAIPPRAILLLEKKSPSGDGDALFDAFAAPVLRQPSSETDGTLARASAEIASEFFGQQLRAN